MEETKQELGEIEEPIETEDPPIETPENPPEETEQKTTSILNSVKKLLGIDSEMKEFDLDILMHINNAISILSQIGVKPLEGFLVLSENETYKDYLGDEANRLGPHVGIYLMFRTRLGFDPPQSSVMTECIKEAIKELETRISYMVDPEEEKLESG